MKEDQLVVRRYEHLKTNFGDWIVGVELTEDKHIRWGFANNEFDIRPYSPAWKNIRNIDGNKADAAKQIINSLESEPTIKVMEDHWKAKILDLILPLNFPEKVKRCCKNCMFFDDQYGTKAIGRCTACGSDSLDGIDTDDENDCNFFKECEC